MPIKIGVWRTLWYILSILFFIAIIRHFGDFGSIVAVLRQGNPLLLLSAASLQGLFLINQSLAYQNLYLIAGIKEKFSYLFRLTSATHAASLLTPTGSIGGTTYFVQAQRLKDVPSGKSIFVNLLLWFLDYLVIALILIVGLTLLALQRNVTQVHLVAAALMAALMVALFLSIVLIVQSPKMPQNVVGWIIEGISSLMVRLTKKGLDKERALQSFKYLQSHFATVLTERNHLTRPFFFVALNRLILFIMLGIIFVAFREPLDFAPLITTYATIVLLTIISFTPSGLGLVEPAATLVMTSYGIPAHSAIVIVLTFRLVTFWIPLIVGYANMRQLHADANVE